MKNDRTLLEQIGLRVPALAALLRLFVWFVIAGRVVAFTSRFDVIL